MTWRFLGVLLAPVAALSTASAQPIPIEYQSIGFAKSGYDYAPSILWDPDSSTWVMYHCGYYSTTNSDAIFRSTSGDGQSWSAPAAVLTVGNAGDWDDGHVCDPTVVHTETDILLDNHKWAMWYTGVDNDDCVTSCVNNRVGFAVSENGITWRKFAGPVVGSDECPSNDSYWGCGQPSVVKIENTYYMSHTEFLCSGVDCRNIRARTSANGWDWTSGSVFHYENWSLGPDFLYDNGAWYSVVGGNQRCGESTAIASEFLVYRSSSMAGAKTLVGCFADSYIPGLATPRPGTGERRFIAEQGFYRGGDGQIAPASPDIWIAFALSADVDTMHTSNEDIRAAKLSLFDGQDGAVDTLWGDQQCSGSGIAQSSVYSAWDDNGPVGDDINYWTLTSDGDGTAEYCDTRLHGFGGVNFSGATKLTVKWYGWADTSAAVGFDLFLVDAVGGATFLGSANSAQYTQAVLHTDIGAIPRSNVVELLFRMRESKYTNLYQSGKRMRLHIYSVKLE